MNNKFWEYLGIIFVVVCLFVIFAPINDMQNSITTTSIQPATQNVSNFTATGGTTIYYKSDMLDLVFGRWWWIVLIVIAIAVFVMIKQGSGNQGGQ